MQSAILGEQIDNYTAFLTKDDILFTAREYHPELGKIRAMPCYYADPAGDRWSKLLNKNFRRQLDEFGDIWVCGVKPDYIVQTNVGKAILVPLQDIAAAFDPFKVPKEIKNEIAKTKFQPILDALKSMGLPEDDIGIYGSYLCGLQHGNSDIDIVIRGVENMRKLKRDMGILRSKLNAVGYLDDARKAATIERYVKIYNLERNDFNKMIERRWSTIRKDDDIMMKLMFTYKNGERPENLLPEGLGEECCVEGVVIDDEGVCFMPRHFVIKNAEGTFRVLTYFYNYYFAVQKGDKVRIFGTLSKNGKTIVLHDNKQHGIKFKNGS